MLTWTLTNKHSIVIAHNDDDVLVKPTQEGIENVVWDTEQDCHY